MLELSITILQKTLRSKFEDGTKTTICKVHRFLGILVQKNKNQRRHFSESSCTVFVNLDRRVCCRIVMLNSSIFQVFKKQRIARRQFSAQYNKKRSLFPRILAVDNVDDQPFESRLSISFIIEDNNFVPVYVQKVTFDVPRFAGE